MKRVVTLLLCLVFVILASSCQNTSVEGNEKVNTDYLDYYMNVPEVTQEEIYMIEALKASTEYFTYGSLIGTELYEKPDGSLDGFTYYLCKLLTDFFGIEFKPEIYNEWSVIKNKYDEGTLDFFGELCPTPERNEIYYMSSPIAEHALRLFTLEEHSDISKESELSGLRIGFLENTVTAAQIMKSYPISFDVVDISSYEDAAKKLINGEIDAFVEDADSDMFFLNYSEIYSRKFFPMVYSPVSMSTVNSKLSPIISVINKYLTAGGIDNLMDLYDKSEREYAKYKFHRFITDEEIEYLEKSQVEPVKIALENDNYPISFYNKSEGTYQGIAIDIINEISSISGINFEIATDQSTNWTNMLDMLKAGEVAMLSQLIQTEDRKEDYTWSSTPYSSICYALLSRAEYPHMSNYQVLRTDVGTLNNSAYEDIFYDWFPDHKKLEKYESYDDGVRALEKREIDLLMASEYILLSQANYYEKTDIKINIILNELLDSYFGFNKDEIILRSIVNKAQTHIDTESIKWNWTNKTFDYQKKAATERMYYFMIFAAVLLMVLIFTLILFVKNKILSNELGKLVTRRTNELDRQTATLTTVYTSIPDIVFSMDTDFNYTSCNNSFEEFVGLSYKDIIGKSNLEVFGENNDMVKFFNGMNEEVIKSKKSKIIEEKIEYHDGKQRIFETIRTPLFQDRKLTGFLGIARDITERKAIEEAAQVASKAKSSFLARISHEIRTPLNAIIGMSNIAKNSISDKEKALFSINQIISSSSHLLALLNDILDMSKIESGKLELVKEPFNIIDAYNEVSGIITQRCLEKDIFFLTNVNEIKDVTIIGDKLRINQVLINLLGNSVKFTEKGGKISFIVNFIEEDDKNIRISYSVKDNGIGMSKEQISRLFQPFEQTDNSIAVKYGGTGLGLSISQNLVNMMGGVIEVENKPDEGSEFFFDLWFEKGEQLDKAPLELPELVNLKGKNVLLVEDIEINRIIIQEVLISTGVEIIEAENGSEAVDMFNNSDIGFYDLIFMDIQMPIMDGYEATKKIRSLEREDAGTVPIVAMTANAYKEDIEQCMKVGMNGHVAKPIDVKDLMINLQKFIGN